jgi:hypothetical protein
MNKTTFDEICEEYNIYIIKYQSQTFKNSIFLIGFLYTDFTQLLTFKSGEIFSSNSIIDIKPKINNYISSLNEINNFEEWLIKIKNIEPNEYWKLDFDSLCNSIKANIPYNIIQHASVFEDFEDYLNLIRVYIKQDNKNEYLNSLFDNDIIKKTIQNIHYFDTWDEYNRRYIPNDPRVKPEFIGIEPEIFLKELIELLNEFDKNMLIT